MKKRGIVFAGLMLILCLGLVAQPQEDPDRLHWEKDWVDLKDALTQPDKVAKLLIREAENLDFSLLDTFPSLEGLIIIDTPIRDFTFLENHPHLKVLEVQGNYLKTLKGLENVPELRELSVSSNFVVDISPLASLPKLTFLRLYDNDITDISVLSGLQEVLQLDLGKNPITTLDPIAENKGLRYLSLFKCSLIVSLDPIRSFTYMTDLNISFTESEDFSLEMVSGLKELENLRIQGIVKNNEELNFITDHTKLVQLTMGRNDGITDISMLDKLVNMEYLDIHSNNVSDITVVSKYPNLVKLVMYRNKVTDISALTGHPELRSLFLNENPIEDFGVLFEHTQLQYLDLDGDKMTTDQKKKLKSVLRETRINFI